MICSNKGRLYGPRRLVTWFSALLYSLARDVVADGMEQGRREEVGQVRLSLVQ